MSVSNRHISSERGWTELECGIGNGPVFGFKIFRTISRLMFVNCWTGLQFTPRGIVPSFASSELNVCLNILVKEINAINIVEFCTAYIKRTNCFGPYSSISNKLCPKSNKFCTQNVRFQRRWLQS